MDLANDSEQDVQLVSVITFVFDSFRLVLTIQKDSHELIKNPISDSTVFNSVN